MDNFKMMLVGNTRDELTGKPMLRVIAWEDSPSLAQYLQWIMGHAMIEYVMRVKPMWKRWAIFHQHHSRHMPIMTMHYGHEGAAYFFA